MLLRLVVAAILAVTGLASRSGALQIPGANPALGSVSGRVMDADTGAPLAGVEIGTRSLGWVTTDSDGRYAIPAIRPGPVQVWIRGDRISNALAAPKTVTIAAGRTRENVDFHVRLDGSISGRVIDENGAPLLGMTVIAVGREHSSMDVLNIPEYAHGELRYFAHGVASTDSQGAFRIGRVRAGLAYRVLAYRPKLRWRPFPQPQPRAMPATYFPAAADFENATPVVLRSLEHRQDVEIRMTSAPAYCLDATTTLEGAPAKLSYLLEEADIYRIGTRTATSLSFHGVTGVSGADGRLRVCDLAPGRYRLAASDSFATFDSASSGVIDVTVTDQDVGGVTVIARPAVSVSLEIQWANAADSARGGMTLRSSPSVRGFSGDWPFPSQTHYPGFLERLHYSLFIGLPPPLYVSDISYDGASILESSFAPSRTAADSTLRITVGRDGGSLTTRVQRADGQPAGHGWVFLLSAAARTEQALATSMIVGLTGDDGVHVAAGLRPGTYQVLATDIAPPALIALPSGLPRVDKSPETLQLLLRARAVASPVDVRPGSSVELRVAPIVLK
jgi:hypothetical protein